MEREIFLFEGGGNATEVLGSSEEILAAAIFTGRCHRDLGAAVRQREKLNSVSRSPNRRTETMK